MRVLKRLAMMAMLAIWGVSQALAGDMMIEDFKVQPETRWKFFADTVMGGVSSGQIRFVTEGDRKHAQMTGRVSIENNGGFIQMRMALPSPPPEGTVGVRLVIRGNDQRYFVHLRTRGAILPWQYYQAGFEATNTWTEVRLPFTDFKASGALLRKVPRADSLTSIGIVAFGRNHDADISVREVAFY